MKKVRRDKSNSPDENTIVDPETGIKYNKIRSFKSGKMIK
jgi:hypothetical protein